MKKIILSSGLLLSGFFIQAQQAPDKISFNSNGEFKIAQFTDMHLGHDQEKDRIVGDMIKEVLDSEKPDLVIFTGDNTTMVKSGKLGKPYLPNCRPAGSPGQPYWEIMMTNMP